MKEITSYTKGFENKADGCRIARVKNTGLRTFKTFRGYNSATTLRTSGHTGAANLRVVIYRYRGHKKTQGIEVGM